MTNPNVPGEQLANRKPRLQWPLIAILIVAALAVATWAVIWGSHWSDHGYNGTHSHADMSDPKNH